MYNTTIDVSIVAGTLHNIKAVIYDYLMLHDFLTFNSFTPHSTTKLHGNCSF